MNYYNRYPGDYARKTQDLSLVEHGAYTLLLDHLYGTQQVLPKNPVGLFRVTRAFTQEEQDAVLSVIKRFFVEVEDGYTNQRFEEERIKAKARIDAARENGKKGGRKQTQSQREPSGLGLGSVSVSQQEPSGSAYHQSSTISHQSQTKTKKEGKPAKPSAIACPQDVERSTWDDWLLVRKAKRAPLTETALNEIVKEANKAGVTLDQALKTCVKRNWVGFDSTWSGAVQSRPTSHTGFSGKNYSEGIGDDGRIL